MNVKRATFQQKAAPHCYISYLSSAPTSCAIATSKDIEAIADMQHRITGDGIHLTIRPTVGIDGSGEV